jgi:hypothetical protein
VSVGDIAAHDDAFLADPGLTVKRHVTDARTDIWRKPLPDFVPRGLSRRDEGELDNLHRAVLRKDVSPWYAKKRIWTSAIY